MSVAVALDFPLCADSERDQAIRPLVEQAVDFLLEGARADQLEAVILTGSLARGEGSVLLARDGFRLLGDMEFLVILRPPFDWPEARQRMVELSGLATRAIGVPVEYAPAGPSYLRRSIRPCIFAYDLTRHGKVVWGRADILSEIRSFGVEAIPPDDAIELTMNRMVELLAPRAANGSDGTAAYQLVKTTLDLAGSALAFAGRYVSSYAGRKVPFGALLDSSPDLRAALPDPKAFQAELELATRCKLAPTEELLLRRGRIPRVVTVLEWAKGIWLWEMRRRLGRPCWRFPELLAGYLSREPLRQRLKGWAKYYRHPLRPPGALTPLRTGRLLLRASPHTLVYAAALLAADGIVEGCLEWRARAALLLPAPAARRNGAVLGQIWELWRWFMRNN